MASEDHPIQFSESLIIRKDYQSHLSIPHLIADIKHYTHTFTVRGCRFRFGTLIKQKEFTRGKKEFALMFLILAEPKVKEKTWICPANMRLQVFKWNEDGTKDYHFYNNNNINHVFSEKEREFAFSFRQLRIRDLVKFFGVSGKVFYNIILMPEPPTGIHCQLPINLHIKLGETFLAVNKELLINNSEILKELFNLDNPLNHAKKEMQYPFFDLDLDTSFGHILHFKILYDILESNDSSQLNDFNVQGVLQLANMWLISSVEIACISYINRKKNNTFSLPEKALLLDMIGARTSLKHTIKNSKSELGASPTKYYRAMNAARVMSPRLLEQMREDMQEHFGDL